MASFQPGSKANPKSDLYEVIAWLVLTNNCCYAVRCVLQKHRIVSPDSPILQPSQIEKMRCGHSMNSYPAMNIILLKDYYQLMHPIFIVKQIVMYVQPTSLLKALEMSDACTDSKMLAAACSKYKMLIIHAETLKLNDFKRYEALRRKTKKIGQPVKVSECAMLGEDLYKTLNLANNIMDLSLVWPTYVFLIGCFMQSDQYKKKKAPAPKSVPKPIPKKQNTFQAKQRAKPPEDPPVYATTSTEARQSPVSEVTDITRSTGDVQYRADSQTDEEENVTKTDDKNRDTEFHTEEYEFKRKLDELVEQNTELVQKCEYQQHVIDEMKIRLSKFTTEEMNKPTHPVELSDGIRPSKLAERFCDVYDNEWSDAFEALKGEFRVEEEIIQRLADIVKSCYDFCVEASEKQQRDIESQMLISLLDPFQNVSEEQMISQSEKHLDILSSVCPRYTKEARKAGAMVAVPKLCEIFSEIKIYDVLKHISHSVMEEILKYTDKLLEVIWLMVIQNPPMDLYFVPTGEKINLDLFSFYSRKGTYAYICTWPAVYLHKDGPLVSKGYVLPAYVE